MRYSGQKVMTLRWGFAFCLTGVLFLSYISGATPEAASKRGKGSLEKGFCDKKLGVGETEKLIDSLCSIVLRKRSRLLRVRANYES